MSEVERPAGAGTPPHGATGAAERVLVTGVAGFIGSNLAESLVARGFDVVGVDSFSDTYAASAKEANLAELSRGPRFRLVRGDLAEMPVEPLLAGVARVFHCAARAGVRSSWGTEFSSYARDNLLATQRLLEAARGASLSRFVYTSSSSVYGNARTLPVDEESPLVPISPYGVTKLAGEHLARLYAASWGVPTVSLRLFTVYGPRQRPDMAFHRFLAAALRDEPIRLFGDGSQTRDFTFVADAVAAILAASEAPGVVGEAINVAGGSRVSLSGVLETIGEVAGRPPRVHAEPHAAGDADHTYASIAKARRLLGYEPRVGLREGLALEHRWLAARPGAAAAG